MDFGNESQKIEGWFEKNKTDPGKLGRTLNQRQSIQLRSHRGDDLVMPIKVSVVFILLN